MTASQATGEQGSHPLTLGIDLVQYVLAHGEEDGFRSMASVAEVFSGLCGDL
jgi:hypothetical protein